MLAGVLADVETGQPWITAHKRYPLSQLPLRPTRADVNCLVRELHAWIRAL
jgi:hypothetical protein